MTLENGSVLRSMRSDKSAHPIYSGLDFNLRHRPEQQLIYGKTLVHFSTNYRPFRKGYSPIGYIVRLMA